MLGREPLTLERGTPELGRLNPAPRDEPELGRRTLWARLGLALGTRLTPLPDRDTPALGLRTAPLGDGRLEGILIEDLGAVDDGGRLILVVRDGFTRGWLTTVLPALDRGTDLVSVGPPTARPTALARTVEAGGRCTTVGRAVFVRARFTEPTRVPLGLVRVTVPVRVLGIRVTVPVRVGVVPTRPTEPVRPYVVGGRRSTVAARLGPEPEPGRPTTPRLGRAAGGLA